MTLIPGIHFPTNREEPVSRDALSLDVGCPGMLSHLMWGVPGAWMGAALVVAVSGAGPVCVVGV